MNDPLQMMNRGFGIWPPAPPPMAADDPVAFQTPRAAFSAVAVAKPGRVNWKGKKAAEKRKRAAAAAAGSGGGVAGGGGGGGGGVGSGGSGYKPPTLKELQFQNRVKARRFYPKKKFTRFAAPRNTTSFIIRAKKSGGIASLVSPCPVTPAILPTPKFSPSREVLVDMAKEEWGVDGYGSMKGLIRLRPGGVGAGAGGMEELAGGDEEEMEERSSESDVEEHLEMERRFDHDLSRFEMVYPNAREAHLLENRVDEQDTHILQLEEENLTLKERMFLMEQEMGDLRRRLQLLETEYRARDVNDINNSSENNNNDDDEEEEEDNTMNSNEEAASGNDGGGDVCSEKSIGGCDESNTEKTVGDCDESKVTEAPMHE